MKSLFLLLLCLSSSALAESRVVLVRGPISNVNAMVRVGLTTLTGNGDEVVAWRQFVSSNDVVGIKVSTQAGPLQVTRPAVVDAIVAGLSAAGVSATNIVVWDRDPGKLRAAGYSGRVVAAAPDDWDAGSFYESKLVGKLIWGDLLFGQEGKELSTRSHLPKLVTQTITKLINVPVLQDHDACGIAGCLHNLSLGMLDNTRRFEVRGQTGDPAIAEICALPAVRGKVVLNVMDALVAGFAGGASFKPQYSWPAGALYFSRDPVAIDSLCLELLEMKRREAKVPEIGPRASHIATAGRLHLGETERNRIELIDVKP